MSAQARHTGPPSSMINQPPCSSAHTEHVNSPSGETTTSSRGRLWTSANLARLRSDNSGEAQCVRYARSISGSPDLENRSGRRSRVRATYAVSLGLNQRACAQPRNARIAAEIFPKFATVARSR